jgi:NAD(P)-dependent dehydrogenase (short-subunit alcohol dehydrogenase family)
MVDVMTAGPEMLRDRVAIVTGAANGIGRAIAGAFLDQGCRVIAIDRDASGLEALAAHAPERTVTLVGDATAKSSAVKAVEHALSSWGRLDILVNNVGGLVGRPDIDATEEQWLATMSLCLSSHFLWSQAAAPALAAHGRGRIINISSNAGRYRSNTGTSGISYSAAKGGVLALTRACANALGPQGITVNAIAPGSVLTGLGVEEAKSLDPALYDRVISETALGYFAPPSEIASVALFLASDDASYVTGATLLANGGWCTS